MSQHPTLRSLLGAQAPAHLSPAKTALMVIDFQNEYFTGNLPIPDGKKALANSQRLINYADANDIKVYHVQHVVPAESPLFAENSQNANFHPDITVAPNHTVVQKSSVSVFVTTDIDQQLKQAGLETLIIVGLMTHACIAGAARDAAALGYSVIVADDACATRDIDTADGNTVRYDVLHRASLASLDDTFADILTTDQVLSLSLLTH